MLLLFFCGIFSTFPLSSAVITCRVACKRCRENTAYPEMLEVYCAMCDECKERRREWLQGQRNLDLRVQNENHLRNDYPDLEGYQDDCSTPPTEEPCEEPIPLTKKVTTTTTTTTTTTHRPCTPKPHCVKTPTRTPCYAMPCPVAPLAIPICQMCPSLGAMPTAPSSSFVPLLSNDKKVADSSTATSDSMYFYVGVPKKLLKDLKLLRS